MASVFARGADEFAALVEGTSTSGQDRHARLLAVVSQLQAVPARTPSCQPRTEFVAELRERLMAEADTVLLPVSDEVRAQAAADARLRLPGADRLPTRERRLALGIGSLALLTSAATVAVGSQVALPGDTLYPIKRALEGASTSLAVGDGETGERLLGHATERLEETEGLTRRAEIDVEATEATLRDFTTQALDGALLMTQSYADTREESRIADLRDFTGDSMDRLAEIEPSVPAEARDELVAAAEAVVLIDDDARNACPSCGGLGVIDLPISLTSTPTQPGSGSALPDLPGLGGDEGGDAGTIIPTDVPTYLPTLLPTGGTNPPGPVPTSGVPTAVPTSGGVPTLPVPTGTKTPLLPLPTLPTLLPSTLLTPLDPLTSLLPLDPISSLLTPLDPLTSLLPLPSIPVLGQVVPDDLGAPSPTPLP